jgi:hypothetical protein
VLKNGNFNRYAEHIKTGIAYSLYFEGLAIISRRPEHIKRDDFYRLHCSDGPAVAWKDGFGQYFWHGIPMSQVLIETPEKITKEDLIKETNAEVRRAMMEKLGSAQFIQLLDVEEIDRQKVGTHVQAKEATLYRTKEVDKVAGEYIQFVNVICHSTEREYMLCVPPDIKDAWEAAAWTFGKTKEEYVPVVET